MSRLTSLVFDLFYVLLLVALSPWLIYQAITKQKYRTGFAAKFLGRVPHRSGSRPCVWLHAVSVGEVNLLAALLAELAQRRPDLECVISTTTVTGFEVACKKYPEQLVFYCPLDFSWAVRAAMRRIRPNLLVLAELELWPNLIRAARAHGARVAVVNGRLSDRSFRGYHRARAIIRPILEQLDRIAVQNRQYADRFLALGSKVSAVCITGSMKFDGVQSDRNHPATQRLRHMAGIRPTDVVFLAGSTGEPEEELAIATYQLLTVAFPALRLIIVPRHPERFAAVAELLSTSGIPYVRRSELERARSDARILLVDTVGELSAWWGTADIAFVGGSLNGRGGQNMIEPAAYGAAVCFGPNTRNFRDIVAQLLDASAAEVVANGEELTSFVLRCLAEPGVAAGLGERAQSLIRRQQGATARTVDALEMLLPAPAQIEARRVA